MGDPGVGDGAPRLWSSYAAAVGIQPVTPCPPGEGRVKVTDTCEMSLTPEMMRELQVLLLLPLSTQDQFIQWGLGDTGCFPVPPVEGGGALSSSGVWVRKVLEI